MKIYETATAPNARRVRIFLHEKSIEDIEFVQMDILRGDNLTEEFKQKNPLAKIPILELDDGTIISESVAICRYFEEMKPEHPLMGANPLEKAIIEQWQRRLELSLLMPTGMCFQHTTGYFKDRMNVIKDWGTECGENVKTFFTFLDKHLASSEYIAGDSFSIADITALITIDFNRVNHIKILDEQSNLKRWYAAVSSRPSAKA
ncbi:glutathione S-transferase family protein [Colwellia sp. Arc7-D]|jgi:glutathione S-transferase|uniref:glutathione S-transferase family protein n=1 Tax=Colwellia sp. Arc7-D TaxID=2161872 RepID=UPI000D3332F2|nr:glutathione S-transferase family protein [Colwellia sp. Arc7-D]AWB57146.1 glutathione S-transferase [Colwellia sp. Arc7-D]|tara:strand:+ start:1781 stop:2392 length:612 start_codon:yes stop_codon:yes gene_type:complete